MAGRNNPPQRPGYAARREREGLAYGSDVQGNPILGGTYNALEPYLGPASAAGLTQIADYTLPFYGGAATVMDGANYIKGGDYGMGAAMIGLGSLEFLPYAGKAARAVNMDGAARFLGDESGAIRAWHGSPHDFDKFSMDKIGTGEGAQAYGHGLYFAENKGTATAYRDNLAGDFPIQVDGTTIHDGSDFFSDKLSNPERTAAARLSSIVSSNGGNVDAAVDEAIQLIDMAQTAASREGRFDVFTNLQDQKTAIRRWRDMGISTSGSPGRLYEVEIDANPEDFLDWDAPLSEQPEVLRRLGYSTRPEDDIHEEAYRIMMEGNAREEGKMWFDHPDLKARVDELQNELDRKAPGGSGQDLYRGAPDGDVVNILSQMGYGDNVGQAERLREAGIPGIRYYDQGSRTAGEGTRNYVVFDDQLISIVKKYGVAGAAAMLGMSQAEVENRL